MDELENRVEAIERAVTEGEHDLSGLAEASEAGERLDELEQELSGLTDRVDELEATTQALRGYVGNVRAVNREVERRAEAALAKAESLESGSRSEADGPGEDEGSIPGATGAQVRDDERASPATTPRDDERASPATTPREQDTGARHDERVEVSRMDRATATPEPPREDESGETHRCEACGSYTGGGDRGTDRPRTDRRRGERDPSREDERDEYARPGRTDAEQRTARSPGTDVLDEALDPGSVDGNGEGPLERLRRMF
jgi:cell division septum initiation protein DivIVA